MRERMSDELAASNRQLGSTNRMMGSTNRQTGADNAVKVSEYIKE